jgi:hypothetical protein
MSALTEQPTRPRRDAAPHPRLLLLGRRGADLLTKTPSAAEPGAWWHQTIPLPDGPVSCDCRAGRNGKRCWHQEEGEAVLAAYTEIRAVQAGMSLRTLRQTAEDTHPEVLREPWAGAVTLTWLAAQASLEERKAQRSVAA